MTMNSHNIRFEDDRWQSAGVRAAAEGTNLSVLIRQWVDDYAAGGEGVRPAKVRLSAAERDAVLEALGCLDIAAVVVDAINKERVMMASQLHRQDVRG